MPDRYPRYVISLFASVLAAAWMALVLAEGGIFHPVPVGLAAAVALAACLRYLPVGFLSSTVSSRAAWAMAILSLGMTLFISPPGETLLGGWDPGVYLHTASGVHHDGSLRLPDSDLAELSALEKSVVANDLHGIVEPFGGMRILPDGRTSPAFHHVYPSLMASLWSFGGVRAAMYLNILLYASTLLMMGLFASMLLSGRWGVAAVLLLAFNPSQVWQAGFSTAELLSQFMLMGAVVLFVASQGGEKERGSDVIGCLAGAAIGMSLLNRYDTILFMAPMIFLVVAAMPWLPRRRAGIAMLLGMTPFLIHYAIHLQWIAPYYRPVSGLVLQSAVLVVGILIAWLVLVGLSHRLLHRRFEIIVTCFLWLSALTFSAWVLFTWAIRPIFLKAGPLPDAVASRLLVRIPKALHPLVGGPDSGNMLYLFDVFGPPGFILAMAGVALWMIREKRLAVRIWLLASTGVLMLIVTRLFNDHFLMWASRRFIPVIIPLLVLACVYAIRRVSEFGSTSKTSRILAAALLMGVLGMQARGFNAMRTIRDWPGVTQWFEVLSASVPDQALLYCDQPGFAAPLRYLHRKHAFELMARDKDRYTRLCLLMTKKLDAGQEVLLLSMRPPLECTSLVVTEILHHPLSTHHLNQRRLGLPVTSRERGGDFRLYRVTRTQASN